MVVMLVVVLALGPGFPLVLGPGPYIVKVTGGEPGGEGGPDESGEES